jgi:hypothetical protein
VKRHVKAAAGTLRPVRRGGRGGKDNGGEKTPTRREQYKSKDRPAHSLDTETTELYDS